MKPDKQEVQTYEQKKVFLVPEAWGDAWLYFIQYLKQTYTNEQVVVVAVDCKDNIPIKYIADIFVVIPEYNHQDCKTIVRNIIREYGITDIAATFEHWIDLWQEIIEMYYLHCPVGFEFVSLFKDKYKTFLWAKQYGIPVVETYLLEQATDQDIAWLWNDYYLKPRWWSGSKMNFHCKDTQQLYALQAYIKTIGSSYILQPFLAGEQRSVDLLIDRDNCKYFTRKSLMMQWSRTFTTSLESTEKFTTFMRLVVDWLPHTGIYNLDCIEKDGVIHLLEVNPRLWWWSYNAILWWYDIYHDYLQLQASYTDNTSKKIQYKNSSHASKKIIYEKKWLSEIIL